MGFLCVRLCAHLEFLCRGDHFRRQQVMVSVMSTLITGIRWLFAGVSYLRHEIAETLADNYRPEMHYMRGPGPKWREKHGFVLGVTHGRR
jgi:hypothetical protein